MYWLALADVVADIALQVNIVAASRRRTRCRLPESGRRRVDRPRRCRGVGRCPVDCTVQGGGATLAVLLEAQVDGGERAADVRDAVDDEPPLQGIAAAPVAIPIKTAKHRIVERVALQARVVTRLELSELAHGLEITCPLLVSIDSYRQVTCVGSDRKGRGRLSVRIRLSLADVVARIALQVNIVAASRRRTRCRLPESGRRRVDRPRRCRGVGRCPVDCTVQGGGATLAALLEAQVDGGERAADIRDAVDDEPALQGIAAAPVTRPIKTAFEWVVKRVALQARVVTRLELSELAHGLEITCPLLVSIDSYRQVTCVGSDRKGRGRLSVRIGLTLADVVTCIALQVNIVAASRRRTRCRLPESGRRRVDRSL